MNQQELKSQYYDIAREYLDEHGLFPDYTNPYASNEDQRHSAHVALIDLLVSAYLDGINK